MTVKVTTEQRAQPVVKPTITFPFLWRGLQTGSVYLRLNDQGRDLLVVPGANAWNQLFAETTTSTSALTAWDMRLGPHEAVILQNTV